jgi:hypothetical protein
MYVGRALLAHGFFPSSTASFSPILGVNNSNVVPNQSDFSKFFPLPRSSSAPNNGDSLLKVNSDTRGMQAKQPIANPTAGASAPVTTKVTSALHSPFVKATQTIGSPPFPALWQDHRYIVGVSGFPREYCPPVTSPQHTGSLPQCNHGLLRGRSYEFSD